MIIKDRNPADHPPPAKFTAAGARAEEQMAFYLKRAFGASDNQEVLVFNDLRLANDKGDDFAQIDHLVFYRRGMILIESKSVTSEVRINAHGEWSRFWDGAWKGMESPILQAKRQLRFLKDLLNDHDSELRGKMAVLGLQLRFGACPFDTIVAISDQGSIDRGGGTFPEVMKAEAVVDEITRIIAKHRLGLLTPSLDMNVGSEKFTDTEMVKIRDFLKRRHRPIVAPAIPPSTNRPVVPPKPIVPPVFNAAEVSRQQRPSAPHAADGQEPRPAAPTALPGATPVKAKSCRHCQGSDIHVEYGKFGYYLKCSGCHGNTAIDFACACGQKARIRKEREQFFKECGACGTSVLYHVNAAPIGH